MQAARQGEHSKNGANRYCKGEEGGRAWQKPGRLERYRFRPKSIPLQSCLISHGLFGEAVPTSSDHALSVGLAG
jgi:hypothetical protein